MEKPFWSIMPHLRPHCNLSRGNSCISTNPHGPFMLDVLQAANLTMFHSQRYILQYIGRFLTIAIYWVFFFMILSQINLGLYQPGLVLASKFYPTKILKLLRFM